VEEDAAMTAVEELPLPLLVINGVEGEFRRAGRVHVHEPPGEVVEVVEEAKGDRRPAARTVELMEEPRVVHDAMPLLADGGCAGEHLGARQEALQDFEVQLLRQAGRHGGAVEAEILKHTI
jgi:hypothetical protein